MVTWVAPWNGGAAITDYQIEFLKSDGDYVEYDSFCDGSQAEVLSSLTCTIDNDKFTLEPFSHTWGSSIFIKVMATNVKGSSVMSLPGNGGKI